MTTKPSEPTNPNMGHRLSLTVESPNPMHLIASGKATRRFSTQAETTTHAGLFDKFLKLKEGRQNSLSNAAVADKLEDQEVNLRRLQSIQQEKK